MKDKRNCNSNYPIYSQPMMPMQMPTQMPNQMPMQMQMPYQIGYNQGYLNNSISSNTYETQINNLEQQLNLLDQRVTRLESLNKNNMINNKYTDSNYYMV